MRALFWLSAVFAILGVSLRDLIDSWASYPAWTKLLLLFSILFSAFFLWCDAREWWKGRPKRYKTSKAINEYMLKLFQRGGSAWIFANHLSWINDSLPIRNFLAKQAKACKDIRIYVPRHNDITRRLADAGVRIITYESLGYEPEARFTLLNPGEPGSSLLAIGKGAIPNFYIEEFPDLTHSRAISVARDLFQIIERVNQCEHT
jgi:hypothetical protein